CFDPPTFHGISNLWQFRAGFRSYPEQSRAIRVGIAISAQKNVVAVSGARDNVDQLNVESPGELQREPKFFIGHPARGDDGNFRSRKLFYLLRCLRDYYSPVGSDKFFSRNNLRFEQSAFRLHVIEVEAAVIAHPAGVDSVVLARRLSINDIFARADYCVATSRATCADTFRFL